MPRALSTFEDGPCPVISVILRIGIMRVSVKISRLFVLLLLVVATIWQVRPVAAQVLSANDRAIYRAAFKAVDQGKWADARRLAGKAKNQLPAKFIQWLDLVRPGPGRSFDEITQFMRENPDWPYGLRLQAMAERNMSAGLPPDEVVAWFGGRTPQTGRGAAILARAMNARGQQALAADLARRTWRDNNFENGDELAFLAEFGRELRPDDHLARLDRLLWSHNEDAARRVMPLVDAGHRALAEARLALSTQASNVAVAVAAVPGPLQHDPGLLYELARSRIQLDDYQGAASVLNPPPSSISRPDVMWPVLADTARHAAQRGDMKVAYRLAAAHGATQGQTFADGEWLAGWIALRYLHDHKKGYEHFTTLYAGVTSQISKARGAYWAGRAAEEMGDAATAQNWYRAAASNLTTYYGQLAGSRVGDRETLRFGHMPQPSKAERASFDRRELVRLIRSLAQLDESDRTRAFLQKMADDTSSPGVLRMIADLGHDMRRDDLAVMVAKTARNKGIDLIDYLYPLRAIPPLGNGPENSLVLSVIRQESAFEQKASSPAGALGLMQLMPRTAQHVSKTLKLRYHQEQLTRDGGYNIRLGRAYLQELLGYYDGSYVLSIAAYNAGPDRVNGWISLFGDPRDNGVDVVDWVETIPWSETRNYVQRVLENLQVYRHRLGGVQIAQSLQQDLLRRSGQ
jgi:soluble lytic murein transglycosylase